MPWPQATDYNGAIQCPQVCFGDPDLRPGQAVGDLFGLPRPHAGNFADVYQVRSPDGQAWAVKCFTREVPGRQERYAAISDHLARQRRPFTVDFRYLPEGIRVRGEWFPVVKMRWVEGLRLNEFVREHADKPALLEKLALMWVRLAAELRDARLGHGDLQHGNVLLVPGSKNSSLALRLIDYDGLWVPALAESPSGEVGHPHYQHPERLRDGLYGPEVDRFSHLLISAALRCIQAGGRELWDRYDNGENLLFREDDFRRPGDSRLLAELWALGPPDAHALVGHLLLASQGPAAAVPRLEDLAARGAVEPLTAAEEARVDGLLGVAGPAPRRRARRAALLATAAEVEGPAVAPLSLLDGSAPTATLAVAVETVPEMKVVRPAAEAVPAPRPVPTPDLARLASLWPLALVFAAVAVVLFLVLSVRLLVGLMAKPQPQGPPEPRPARLRAPPALAIRAGQREAVDIAVERGDSAGPLTVRLEGAPGPVTCPPLTLEDGQDAGRLELGAAADAPAGAHPVRLTLWEGERQTDEQPVSLTVEEFLPPQLLGEGGNVSLRPGEKRAVVVAVDRRGCVEPLKLELDKLPAGVTQRSAPCGPAEKAVRLELAADPGAPASSGILRMTLWAGRVPAHAQQIIVVVEKAPEAAPSPGPGAPRLIIKGPVTLRPGSAQDVLVELERNGYAGAVALQVDRLPEGVKCDATEVPAGKDNAVVEFRAGADAADASATVRVQARADGRKLDEQEITVTVERPAAAVSAPRAPPGERVSFVSLDGVTLRASYYAARKGKDSGCVLLLHDPDLGPAADDWGRLAAELQGRGYAVLRLDFRGHGGSTSVAPAFWGVRTNQALKAYLEAVVARRPPPTEIGTDQPDAYRPWLVHDIVTARTFLDEKNDRGELNSSNLVVVGAGGGAMLGLIWLASERVLYEAGGRVPESRHIAAAVWLELPPTLAGQRALVTRLLKAAGDYQGVRMNFVFGAGNARGRDEARSQLGLIRLFGIGSAATAVPGARQAGQALLEKEPTAVRVVADCVERATQERGVKPWAERRVRLKAYQWRTGTGVQVPAKLAGETAFRQVPLEWFGVPVP
jgi:alpha-beta hydrolase superfamily lysophospholipase